MSGRLIDHNSNSTLRGLAVTDTACHRNVAVQDLTLGDLLQIRKRAVLRRIGSQGCVFASDFRHEIAMERIARDQ